MRVLASMRVAAGLTRGQLAARLGVYDECVIQWERGISYPPQYLLADYAAALRCSMDDLRHAINAERLRAGCPRCGENLILQF